MYIYLDMNIYNRVFDDQSQLRIKFETMATDIIFELIEKEQYQSCWSFMLDDENYKNPFSYRRSSIKTISSICKINIGPNSEILNIGKFIMANSNTKPKDALHLACAVYCKCDYFITCDDKFIKTVVKNNVSLEDVIGKIKLMNPIDFVRGEMSIDVIE